MYLEVGRKKNLVLNMIIEFQCYGKRNIPVIIFQHVVKYKDTNFFFFFFVEKDKFLIVNIKTH